MPKPFPKEFRDDVVRVAQNRDPEVTLAQIAKDFDVHIGTLDKRMRQARVAGISMSEMIVWDRMLTPGEKKYIWGCFCEKNGVDR